MQRSQWRQRLLKTTRGQILALLKEKPRTVNDMAELLNLTRNAVRAQLLSLERDGLVQQRGMQPGTRRPHAEYGLTSEVEHVFPKAYGSLLNHVVTAVAKRLEPGELSATMREVGRAIAREYGRQISGRSRAARIDAAIEVLHELGGSAAYEEVDGQAFIRGQNGCPLAAVTKQNRDACLIVESLLSEITKAPVTVCCNGHEEPRCCFQLDAARKRQRT